MLDKQAVLAAEFLNRPFEPAMAGGAPPQKKRFPPPPAAFGACFDCHGEIGGSGSMLGPDISDVGMRYTKEQLQRLLVNPEEFNITGMGKFNDDKMDPAERNGLIDYLISLSKQ